MNTHFTLDRESLQNLLARASLAQEYLDSQKATCPAVDRLPKPAIGEQPKETIPVEYIQSLSAIAAVQRSIATDSVEVDGAMAIIADQARNVANANGVAIGLLEGDNLVYRAGSGGAATYIGRHVKATLSVSRASGEILRVENTQTDARIEAAICRHPCKSFVKGEKDSPDARLGGARTIEAIRTRSTHVCLSAVVPAFAEPDIHSLSQVHADRHRRLSVCSLPVLKQFEESLGSLISVAQSATAGPGSLRAV